MNEHPHFMFGPPSEFVSRARVKLDGGLRRKMSRLPTKLAQRAVITRS